MRTGNGGSAFPSNHPAAYGTSALGMSLRDYFAAKAMAAVWSKLDPDSVRDVSITQTAATAYRLADAMLAEGEKP